MIESFTTFIFNNYNKKDETRENKTGGTCGSH